MRRNLLYPMVIAIASSGPVPGAASGLETAGNQQQAIEEVKEAVKGLIAADNAGDLDKAISYYADDAVLMPPTGPDISGKTRIRNHYAGLLRQQALEISNKILDTVISGDWAISRGVNRVSATSRLDRTQTLANSKYLMTLRRQSGGEWRIVHLIWSNQPAEP